MRIPFSTPAAPSAAWARPGADAGGRVAAACQRPAGAVAGHAACRLAAGFSGGFALSGFGQRHAGQHQSATTDWLRMARWVPITPSTTPLWCCTAPTAWRTAAQPLSLLNGFAADGQLRRGAVAAGAADWLATAFVCAKRRWPSTLNAQGDALANLDGALRACQRGVCEVAVYFQRALWRGNRVLKTDAQAFAAFAAPNDLPLIEDGLECRVHGERFCRHQPARRAA